MIKNISFFFFLICITNGLFGQIKQTHTYELEKKNYDDYFTVLPAGEDGVIIFRDTDDYRKGDLWQVVSLDTTLCERWNQELSIDSKYNFKGSELRNSSLYLIFRNGDGLKSDYHVLVISIKSGEISRYDIKNDIELKLSHLIIIDDKMILAGYVNNSPTLVSYQFGSERFEVIPGFFKDRSYVVDVKGNKNTFNTITLEKEYNGSFLRLKTYSLDGDLIFEKTIETNDKYYFRSAKSSGFINGNIVVSGTYSVKKSYYAAGIYLAIVKPNGQDNIVNFYGFDQFEHFFDYLKPKKAVRLKNKFKRRAAKGKEIVYSSRVTLNEIKKDGDGFIVEAEIYDPQYTRPTRNPYDNSYNSQQDFEQRGRSSQSYSKQASSFQNVDNADLFKYLQSTLIRFDKNGKIIWDNSFKLSEVESNSLEQTVHFINNDDVINMVCKSTDQIGFKTIQDAEMVEENIEPIKLQYEFDKIIHTYKGTGRSLNWYGNNFIVWGYHKIENKVDTDKKNRNVLFVNKIEFK
jgi:hypothetical protein